MSSPLIDVKDLSFSYGATPVLDAVSLQVHAGDYLGLIGPNGSGKTTLLKLMLGLIPPPSSGRIHLFGGPVSVLKDWWRVGYVAQKAASFNTGFPATVGEIVQTGRAPRRGLFRFFTREDYQAVDDSLERVGMESFKNRMIGRLSGGQQQRVFIARALVSQPQLLILDEPTVGVDVQAEAQFYRLIRELRQQMGLTVILVSHDIGAVGHEVTSLACLNRKLFYHGAPDQFGSEDQLCELYGHHVRSIHHHHH